MPIEKQNQSKPRGPDFGRDRAYREQSHCRAKEGEPRIPVAFLIMWHTSELIIWRGGSESGAKMSVACRFLQRF
jgi:hypothetical protein